MAVVNNIKQIWECMGTTQKNIAAKTNFPTRIIRAVERGERNSSTEFIFRIAAYFDLMVEDISKRNSFPVP